MTSLHRWSWTAALALLGCASTGPSEPLNSLTLPAALSVVGAEMDLGAPTPDVRITLGNAGSTVETASFGVCAFLVRGYESAARTGGGKWSYLLPEIGGCGPDLLYVIDVPPNGFTTIVLGAIPASLLIKGSSLTVFYQVSGETTLRMVNVAQIITD